MKKERIGRISCEVIAILAAITYVILRFMYNATPDKNLNALCILTASISIIGYGILFAFFERSASKLSLIGIWLFNLILSVVLLCKWDSLKKKSIFFFLPQEGFLFLLQFIYMNSYKTIKIKWSFYNIITLSPTPPLPHKTPIIFKQFSKNAPG